MAKSTRDYLKRQLAQAYYHLDVSMERTLGIRELFKEHHPELAEGLEIAANVCLQAQQVLLTFAKDAWAMDEKSVKAYQTNKQ